MSLLRVQRRPLCLFLRVFRLFRNLCVSRTLDIIPRALHLNVALFLLIRIFIFAAVRCAQQLKKIHLPFHIVQLICTEQADHTVFPVKSRNTLHIPFSETPDTLGNPAAGYPADILQRQVSQDLKFRPQFCEHFLILFLHFFAGRRTSHRSSDHLRERHKAFKCLCVFAYIPLLPVCQFFHAVRNADRQLSAAHRAFSAVLHCLGRRQAQITFSVTVHMVFAFFWKELYSPMQPLSRLNGAG